MAGKTSGEFPETEHLKSKFMVWMENNIASIEGVDYGIITDDYMNTKFLWDPIKKRVATRKTGLKSIMKIFPYLLFFF